MFLALNTKWESKIKRKKDGAQNKIGQAKKKPKKKHKKKTKKKTKKKQEVRSFPADGREIILKIYKKSKTNGQPTNNDTASKPQQKHGFVTLVNQSSC